MGLATLLAIQGVGKEKSLKISKRERKCRQVGVIVQEVTLCKKLLLLDV